MSEQHSTDSTTAGVIAPPPLIAVATILIGLFMDYAFPLLVLVRYFSWSVRLVLGGLLLAAGIVLALLALRRFTEVGTNVSPFKPTLALATAGIYRWLRNPVYLGLGLAVTGIGFGLGSEWMLILLIPAAWVVHNGVVLREERYLESRFNDDYRRYKASVPRYGWPR